MWGKQGDSSILRHYAFLAMLFQFYNSYHSNNYMHVFSVQEWTLFFSVLLIFRSQMKLERWLVVHHLMIGCSMHTRWEARVYPSTYTTDTARNDRSTSVEVMACCCQGTSHYLKQWLAHIPFAQCQLTLLFLRYGYFKIWPWKSKVNVMAKVKPDGQICGLELNR